MRKLGLAMILAAALGGGTVMTSAAQAAPIAGLDNVAAGIGLVEQSQFIIGGRNYCWYDRGWHGPGWYWCGYAWRRGFGWGGPRGWHGWVWHGHRRPVYRHPAHRHVPHRPHHR